MNARRSLAVALFLAVFATLGNARAATPSKEVPVDTSPEARSAELKRRGNEAMFAEQYADALTYYEQARALAPRDSALLYSEARANEYLARFPAALDLIERFEAEAPPEYKAKIPRLAELHARLQARVATLDVRCDVSGARIVLDDKILGTTPLAEPVRTKTGAADVRIELEGFFPLTRPVVLPSGGVLRLDVTLSPRRTSAQLAVESAPTGAVLVVDGTPRGTASPRAELLMPAGPHRIVARAEGYDDADLSVLLAAGESRAVRVDMRRSVPLTGRWYFWAGLGTVVAAGVVTTIALVSDRPVHRGTVSPGQVSAPLLRF